MPTTHTTPEADLLAALDASDTGLWTWTLATQAVTWTPVCYRLLGVPPSDTPLAFDGFLAAVHPEDRHRVQEEIALCVRARQAFNCEFRVVRPDGAVRWLANTGRCSYDAGGEPVRMAGSVRDITDAKRTELVLHDSQERLRLAVEASGIGLWTWDLATDAVTWSSESYRIHGLEDGEFAGTGAAFFALVHPADRERVEQTVRAALARNQQYACEFRIVRPDGSTPWVTNRGRARYDAEGRPTGMLGTIADITATREAEQAMQAALEASSTGTFRWDIRSNALNWDEALDRLFGLPPGEAVRSLEQFIARVHPDDRAGVLARCERCRTDGAHFDMEFRIVRPDGTERWLYDRGRTFRDHLGRPASMTGACVDITHRKHTELALRRSESFYRQALESLPGMTYTTTADGWWDYFSEQWQAYTGTPTSQLLGHSWPAALHPDDRPRVAACVDDALARKAAYQIEYRVRRHDGAYRWFQVRCQPVLDPAGAVASWIGTAVDVHDLKLAQAALAENGERLRRAQQAGGIGVWELDAATGMAIWSEHTACLLGRRPPSLDAVPGDFWRTCLHPEDLVRVEASLRAAYASGRFHEEFRPHRADGTLTWLESQAELVRAGDGTPLRLVGTVRDVSQRRAAEDALRRADRLKDEFLATLAHELRNPLSPLRTGLELLRLGRGGPEAQARTRAMMERQLSHLVRLVDDLLDVARISQGKIEIRRERVDVATVIAHAQETARQLVESRRHRVTLELPAEPLHVEGDITRLAQVAGNLLVNAAKYTPEGGEIRVAARATGDGHVELSVADNGLGIPDAMLPRVFDLFVQVDRGGQPTAGLGIGLALVRRLVELHGGSVRVESAGEGRGSTFTVRLPLARATQPSAGAAGAPAAAVAPTRVLVVDDNTDAAEAMRLMLELAGHEVRVAADGPSALEGARAFRPAVTFLDLGLPGMSGYEVARRFKADAALRGGLLVALTGWGSEDDKRRCVEAGFDLHLTKPVDPARVDQVLAAPGTGTVT